MKYQKLFPWSLYQKIICQSTAEKLFAEKFGQRRRRRFKRLVTLAESLNKNLFVEVEYSTHSLFHDASWLHSSLISIQDGQSLTLIPFQKLTLWLEMISTGLNWPEPLPELLSCNITCPCKFINWERPLDWSLVALYLRFVWLLYCPCINSFKEEKWCFNPSVLCCYFDPNIFLLCCSSCWTFYFIYSFLLFLFSRYIRFSFNVLFGNGVLCWRNMRRWRWFTNQLVKSVMRPGQDPELQLIASLIARAS